MSLSLLILSGLSLQLIPSSEYFQFIYCILECQDLCLMFLNIFCLCCNSRFVNELPQTWLSIFMIVSLNSMSLNYIFVSSGFVSGDFTCFWDIFSCFFIFLDSLHWSLHIRKSNHLFQFLRLVLYRRGLLSIVQSEILGTSQTFMLVQTSVFVLSGF